MTEKTLSEYIVENLPPNFVGYAVEAGACDGVYISNTLVLEKAGWDVLCIEPNQIYYEDLKDNRKLSLNVALSSFNSDEGDLFVYDRDGVPEVGWEASEPVSCLGELSEEYLSNHCPDARPPSHQKVLVRTLDWCLDKVGFPRLDVLSLDVDGLESEILKGLSIKKWGVKVALIENPSHKKEIHDFFTSNGYTLKERLRIDEVWVL